MNPELESVYPRDLGTHFTADEWVKVETYLGLRWSEYKSCAQFEEAKKALEDDLRLGGLLDEFGQFRGSPGFGTNPLFGAPVALEDVNHYDFDHGDKTSPIVADLGCATVEEGKALWGDRYLVLQNGEHGPARFRSTEEKEEYKRVTHHREKGSFTS